MRTIQMSDYTVGEDAFDAIPETLAAYGAKTVVLVGGRRALDAAAPGITAALAGTDVAILDTVVYGTDSTRTNVNRLVAHPAFAEADVAFAIGGGKAIDTVKTAINKVSTIRGNLGATQNRLEHTINNLSVMEENIQNAESTIRDTDVAEEMMSYVKNNILVQSAQAMLAQANQVPQGVLQLLQ